MKKYILLFAFAALIISCTKEVSTASVDDFVSSIDGKIKNEKLRFKKISGFESFVSEVTCYYLNDRLVCIKAAAGSDYDLNTYSFYLNDGRLVLSRIEYAMLKMDYWDDADKPQINDKNSRMVREESYFLNDHEKIITINRKKYSSLSGEREKAITDQFNTLYKISESYQ